MTRVLRAALRLLPAGKKETTSWPRKPAPRSRMLREKRTAPLFVLPALREKKRQGGKISREDTEMRRKSVYFVVVCRASARAWSWTRKNCCLPCSNTLNKNKKRGKIKMLRILTPKTKIRWEEEMISRACGRKAPAIGGQVKKRATVVRMMQAKANDATRATIPRNKLGKAATPRKSLCDPASKGLGLLACMLTCFIAHLFFQGTIWSTQLVLNCWNVDPLTLLQVRCNA
mmetsp:Transcript_41118/g.66218  ORF Transcript_41118/g.66218 Transcript_41118/m.66218 type:complete len:230 (+) Transcript_41118:288-977(+)